MPNIIKKIPYKRELHIPMKFRIFYCKSNANAYPMEEWNDEWTEWNLDEDGELPIELQPLDEWTEITIENLENAVKERATKRFKLDQKPSLCIEIFKKEDDKRVQEWIKEEIIPLEIVEIPVLAPITKEILDNLPDNVQNRIKRLESRKKTNVKDAQAIDKQIQEIIERYINANT